MINLVYHTGHSGKTNRDAPRRVEPYRLHHYMGSWYLVGYCHQRMAARIFQVARIAELELDPETYTQPRFDVDAHIHNSYGIFKGGTELQPVVLKFDPFMARFVGLELWHPDQRTETTEDGGLLLTIPVADLTEIMMQTLRYGHHVEVLGPPELRRRMAEELERMNGIYGPQ